MKKVNKSFKFRLYPSKKEKEILDFNMDCRRFVYNHVKATYEMYKAQVKELNLPPIYANR